VRDGSDSQMTSGDDSPHAALCHLTHNANGLTPRPTHRTIVFDIEHHVRGKVVGGRTYTVKQAATILGVAEMTVRRLAQSGGLPAERAGRSWLLEAAAVDRKASQAGRPRPQTRPVLAFDLSLHQVVESRKRDWIPDPLGWHDVLSDPDHFLESVAARWESGAIDGHRFDVLPIPKSSLLSRPGAILSLADEVLYHALVLKAAPVIARNLSSAARGYRPKLEGHGFLEPTDAAWRRYQSELRASPSKWTFGLSTDIAAYFEQIRATVLKDALLSIGVPQLVVGGIQGLLAGWERTTGLSGLPQGSDASRVLANIYLLTVDAAMETACRVSGWHYVRWMDDVTVLAGDERSLQRASFLLETELRRLGLNLSSAKTEIKPIRQVAQDAVDPILGQIDYAFRLKQFDRVKADAWAVLRNATGNFRTLDPSAKTPVKFALYRLGVAKDPRAIDFVLRQAADAGFIADFLYLYLRHFSSSATVVAGIAAILRSLRPPRDAYLAAHLLRVLYGSAAIDGGSLDPVRSIAWNTDWPPSTRALAIRTLGRHSQPADSLSLRERLWAERESVCIRATLAALREADPRTYRSAFGDFKRLHPEFANTVAYLIGTSPPPVD
jgi:excisionase family DNA binding protein